jgi:predicted ester cyclase
MDRRSMIARAALMGSVIALPAGAQSGDGTRFLAERFAATLSAHDIAGFAALFADDYVNHQMSAAAPPPAAGKTAKQATVDFFTARLTGIPDLQVATEVVMTSPGMVSASFVYTGTHGGPLFGVAPTGRRLRFTSCDIFAVRNELIAEHWGMGDIAGVLAQIRS